MSDEIKHDEPARTFNSPTEHALLDGKRINLHEVIPALGGVERAPSDVVPLGRQTQA